ncbi:MAG: hypothetical protein N2690_10235, partial [Rhodocyclaceae bacterium]|nr:hypothetical protein [Rhodocyclaceae bacterium]
MLLLSLGPDAAAEVLKNLGPREVQKLGHAMAGIKSVPREKVEALIAEMARWADPLAGRTISTAFVGGGTPTVLSPRQLEQLFVAVHRTFH